MEGLDCYTVRAGFTPTIFYLNERRRRRHLQLQDETSPTKTQSEIIDLFGPELKEMLDSDMFVNGDVARTSYSGFLINGEELDDETTWSNQGENTSNQLVDNRAQSGGSSGSGNNPSLHFVLGGCVIGLSVLALILGVGLLIRKQRQKRSMENSRTKRDNPKRPILGRKKNMNETFDSENIPEGFGDDFYNNHQIDVTPKATTNDESPQEPESVISEPQFDVQIIATHPEDESSCIPSTMEIMKDITAAEESIFPMQGDNNSAAVSASNNKDSTKSIEAGAAAAGATTDKSVITADNKTAQSFSYDSKSLENLQYFVVTDLDTTMGGDSTFMGVDEASFITSTEHDYDNCKSPTCIYCKERKFPQPIFVQADLQSIQKDLGQDKNRPKKQRSYRAPNTVQL